VVYNPDPKGKLLVKGRDGRGRRQALYQKKFLETNAAEKYSRVSALHKQFNAIYKENEKNRQIPEFRENADCLRLVIDTSMRPGDEKDTKAKVKSYGASTLEGRHVVQKGDAVRLNFVGKSGKTWDITIDDPGTAKMLAKRAKATGKDGKLFNTTRRSLSLYSQSLGGGAGFQTKDFRTMIGTALAMRTVESMSVPKNATEYKKAVKDVAKIISQKLGNTPKMALQAYINPSVFSKWRPVDL
jgi:DNA topoisomerase-1